ncbi:MAG: LytR/AlgR family response regulator transcription factor [Eubacteriaceae bacterium]
MFKIAICDDEPVITAQIEEVLYNNRELFQYDIEIDVFYSCDNLVSYMKNFNDFDLLFLDIEMGGLSGLELGKIIRNKLDNQSLQIVYVSGKEEYYKDLFDVRPMHFLLKPVDSNILIQDVNLAMKLCNRHNQFFVYKNPRKYAEYG